jgi:hypothetical protein
VGPAAAPPPSLGPSTNKGKDPFDPGLQVFEKMKLPGLAAGTEMKSFYSG